MKDENKLGAKPLAGSAKGAKGSALGAKPLAGSAKGAKGSAELLCGRIGPDGRQVVGTLLAPDEEAKAMLELEQDSKRVLDSSEELLEAVEETAEEVDQRLSTFYRRLEREQISLAICAYAEDCMKRSNSLDGHRAKAFQIRAAIATDIAHKIDIGWGRDRESGVLSKAIDVDKSDVIREAAYLSAARPPR